MNSTRHRLYLERCFFYLHFLAKRFFLPRYTLLYCFCTNHHTLPLLRCISHWKLFHDFDETARRADSITLVHVSSSQLVEIKSWHIEYPRKTKTADNPVTKESKHARHTNICSTSKKAIVKFRNLRCLHSQCWSYKHFKQDTPNNVCSYHPWRICVFA